MRRMDLRQLRSFVEVADRGSFTAAAERLHVVQSAVSQHVRQLERQLGVELLTRAGGVRPTAAGELVLERARRLLAESDAISVDMADLRGLVTGSVRVGCLRWAGTFDVAGVLAAYVDRYPGVDVVLNENSSLQTMADVAAGDLDLAFVSLSGPEVAPGLELDVLGVEEMVLVAAPGSEPSGLAAGEPAELKVVEGQPFVAFAGPLSLRSTVDAALRAAGVRPRIVLESNLLGMVRLLVCHGLGAAVVPRCLAEAPGDELRIWSIAPEPLHRTIGLVCAAGRSLPPAAAALRALALQSATES